MKNSAKLFIAYLCFSTFAYAEPASENTIRALMEVTNTQQLLENMQGQINTVMNNSIQSALRGQTPTPKQQESIARMQDRMVSLLKGELSWEKFEPIYMRLYRESFTEEEAAGMLAFYKTPAGQAVINKMPLLMQKTMSEMQTLMSGLQPGLRKIQEDFVTEMRALNTPK